MSVYLADPDMTLFHGDALDVLRTFDDHSIGACVTSPPYLDTRPEYPGVSPARFELIFGELARVVDGPMIVNVGRLWRDGIELRWYDDLLERAAWAGWALRDTLIWAKPNANPIQGELLTNAHEYVFLFGDDFDTDAIRTQYQPDSIARMSRKYVSSVSVKGDTAERNGPRREAKRGMTLEADARGARAASVFVTSTGSEKGNPHPAPMALELAEHLVLLSGAGSIVDPFCGSGTTCLAARRHGRDSIGIDRDEAYLAMAGRRLAQQVIA